MKNLILVITISAFIGLLNYVFNPNRPNLELASDELNLEMAQNFAKQNSMLIIDARSKDDFFKGHILSAINLSEENFDEQITVFLDAWSPETKIIVYCSSSECNSSRNIANKLKNEFQIKNVFVLKGDWTQWKN